MLSEKSPVLFYYNNSSFINYPGKIAPVFFTSGCNFRCGFCHNASLLGEKKEGLEWDKIKIACKKFKEDWADGAVVTGGEPTLHDSLPDLLKLLKEFNFSVKLDTNGSNPNMLHECLDYIDYVAMDIKCSLERYGDLAKFNDAQSIGKSIDIIKNYFKEYEFRTTVIEKIHNEEEMEKIGKLINGAHKYVLQQFVPTNSLPDEDLRKEYRTSSEHIEKMKQIMKKYVEKVFVI